MDGSDPVKLLSCQQDEPIGTARADSRNQASAAVTASPRYIVEHALLYLHLGGART
jgi:hypothetical protein